MQGALHTLHVWGPMACFSRPEAKVERLSYPIITPSAARGIFDAILWQPGLFWQLTRIELLAPIRTLHFRRNEVKQRGPHSSTAMSWASGREPIKPILADQISSVTGRTLRQTVALRDVAYRLHARLVSRDEATLKARDAQFRRRVSRGQCLYQPYLGNREMACYFRFPVPYDPAPHPLDLDLGLMLYDVFVPFGEEGPSASFFHAKLCQGVLEVPEYHSERVLKVCPG